MKTYDPTKSLRQMFHRPNVVPLYGILLAMTVSYFYLMQTGSRECYNGFYEIPWAKNAHYEPNNLATITINSNGLTFADYEFLGNISKLPDSILDKLIGNRPFYIKKILLKVDKDIEFGKIQKVLRVAKKADIKIVGLITEECVPLFHYFCGGKDEDL